MIGKVKSSGKWTDHPLPGHPCRELSTWILAHDSPAIDAVIIHEDRRWASNERIIEQYRKKGQECGDFGQLHEWLGERNERIF